MKRLAASVERFILAAFFGVLTAVPHPIRINYLKLMSGSVHAMLILAFELQSAAETLSRITMRKRYAAEAYRFKRGPLQPLYVTYWLSRRVLNRLTYIVARLTGMVARRLNRAHDCLNDLIERELMLRRFGPQHLEDHLRMMLASRRGHLETCQLICGRYIESGYDEYLVPLAGVYLKWGQVGRAFDLLSKVLELENGISPVGQLDSAELLLQIATIDNALRIDVRGANNSPTSLLELQRLIRFENPLDMAIRLCDNVLTYGANGRALLIRAEASYLAGSNVDAATGIAKAAGLSRLSTRYIMMWANALRRAGDREGAIRVLTRAESHAADLSFAIRLGRMLIDTNRWTQGTDQLVNSLRQATRSLDR
jgi:hypothetical protein